MAIGRPATKVIDLFEEIRAAGIGNRLDAFSVRRLQRESEAVRRIDYVDGCCLLGFLAAWTWNAAETKAQFKLALAQFSSSDVPGRYAAALALIGDYDESARYSQIAVDADRSNPDKLEDAIASAKVIGRHQEAVVLIEQFAKLSPGRPHYGAADSNLIVERLDAMDEAQDMPTRCHGVALQLLTERKIRVTGVRFDVDPEQRAGGVYCYLGAAAAPEVLVELEDELAVRLFDAVPDLDLNVYWIGYESTHEH